MQPYAHVGALVRAWRTSRHLSQMDLALNAGVSTRHLSCVETGKSQPSPALLARLSDALSIPLREQNALLIAAGFAPKYSRIDLSDDEIAPIKQAIDCILKQQEPYPAFVINRYWDVLMVNDAAQRLFAYLREGGAKHGNILHQVFDPSDMRPHLNNWEEVASDLMRHLHNDIAGSPQDARAKALLNEIMSYPNVPEEWRHREPGTAPLPLLTTYFNDKRSTLAFFSTVSTFGTPRDVTLAEIRIECLFPADDTTACKCEALAA